MENYERYFTDRKNAKETAKQTAGHITSFLSIGENGEPITVYKVTYKQLF